MARDEGCYSANAVGVAALEMTSKSCVQNQFASYINGRSMSNYKFYIGIVPSKLGYGPYLQKMWPQFCRDEESTEFFFYSIQLVNLSK